MRKVPVVSSSVCAARTQTAENPYGGALGVGGSEHDGLDLARVDVADHIVRKHLLSSLVADLGSVLTQEPADLSSGGLGVGAETMEPARGGDVDNCGGIGDKLNGSVCVFASIALRIGMIYKIGGSEHNFYFLSFVGVFPFVVFIISQIWYFVKCYFCFFQKFFTLIL